MLSNGAARNAVGLNGWTPLHYAALTRKDEMMFLLLQMGVDPNARDMFGKTAADYA